MQRVKLKTLKTNTKRENNEEFNMQTSKENNVWQSMFRLV